MSAKAAQLPFVQAEAVGKGPRTFRKQLLPVGEIEHPVAGQVSFDLAEIVRNFEAGAFDMVPFLLADAENRHNDDPEKVRGEVSALELAGDGLYGTIETTERGAKLLNESPKLPVSVRVKRPEAGPFKGQSVLAHVLGTLDPVAKGMAPWEAIDASTGHDVTDLSGGAFSFLTVSKDAQTVDEPKPLSAEELAKLRGILDDGNKPEAKEPEAKADADKDTDPPELTDAEADALVARLLEDADTPGEADKEPAVAALSEADRKTVELAEQTAKDAQAEVAKVREQAAKERFEADKARYVNNGVPPALVECARPFLEAHQDTTIDFSNSAGNVEKVSARKVVTDMLDMAEGTLEFSELGQLAAADSDDADAKKRREEAEAAVERYS